LPPSAPLVSITRSRIFADVLLGFHNQLRVDARAEANLLDISPLDGFPMAGIGPATCRIEGLFQDPHVTGHLRLAGFEFNDFRLGDIETDVGGHSPSSGGGPSGSQGSGGRQGGKRRRRRRGPGGGQGGQGGQGGPNSGGGGGPSAPSGGSGS
jgi:hypothetical protein